MKKFNFLIPGFCCLLGLASCKKQLDEKAHSFLTPDNFYNSAADATSAINGVFSVLQDQKYYQRTVYIISEVSGDCFYPSPNSGDRGDIYSGTYSATNGEIANWWNNSYKMIKNANDVITYVPGIAMDSVQRNNIVGNAYFLRGMAYFDLVRTFGDVPLVLKAGDQDLYPKRAASDQVYAQLISDLKMAEQYCYHVDKVNATNNQGMVSSEAASGMLARAYLQRASTTFAQATDNQDAVTECNKVIAYATANPGSLTLVKNYGDIFDLTKKNGPEILFNVQFGLSPNAVNLTNRMFDPVTAVYGGYGSFIALNSYYNSFAANDTIRRRITVNTVDGGNRYISKWRDPGVKAGASGRTNWIVLRYADVLLMQSEALNNINPGDAAKFDGINKVRARAGLGSQSLSFDNTASSDDFVNAIVNERAWELGVEGQRRWDLIRLKKYKAVKAAQGYTIDDNHLLMPIPQSDIDLNVNLKQNTGW
ncbi:RagB/SusD family nutrient uptake outer membrane protein [Deminuibacter soli]|nr:RagB/SusD family nutrient uptake outer membrane protein [Deminuibacter soli]